MKKRQLRRETAIRPDKLDLISNCESNASHGNGFSETGVVLKTGCSRHDDLQLGRSMMRGTFVVHNGIGIHYRHAIKVDAISNWNSTLLRSRSWAVAGGETAVDVQFLRRSSRLSGRIASTRRYRVSAIASEISMWLIGLEETQVTAVLASRRERPRHLAV